MIALTTNIEEWKRRENAQLKRKQENPRSSTTGDVECMFSIMRDLTGKHFTVREANTPGGKHASSLLSVWTQTLDSIILHQLMIVFMRVNGHTLMNAHTK